MDEQALRAEATALHRALFGRDAPDEIARRYSDAHAFALTKVTAEERDWMARAAGADLEALEIALRGRSPDHVLSRKMRLLVYLCEASPDYFALLVNEEPRRCGALFALAWHALRTPLKSIKGWLLLKARGL
jgi:hypothetical protein